MAGLINTSQIKNSIALMMGEYNYFFGLGLRCKQDKKWVESWECRKKCRAIDLEIFTMVTRLVSLTAQPKIEIDETMITIGDVNINPQKQIA